MRIRWVIIWIGLCVLGCGRNGLQNLLNPGEPTPGPTDDPNSNPEPPAKMELSLELSGGLVGRVISDPPGILCGQVEAGEVQVCKTTFTTSGPVTLKAEMGSWLFYGWTGCHAEGDTDGSCTVNLTESTTIGARFEPANFSSMGGSQHEEIAAVVADPTLEGAYFIAGSYESSNLSLGPGQGLDLMLGQKANFFVAHVLWNGVVDWVHTVHGDGQGKPFAMDVAEENGKAVIYLAGSYAGPMDLNGDGMPETTEPEGQGYRSQSFVMKLDDVGIRWVVASEDVSTDGDEEGESLAAGIKYSAATGEVFVTGVVLAKVNFGTDINDLNVDLNTENDRFAHLFVVGYRASDGKVTAATHIGRSVNQNNRRTRTEGRSIAVVNGRIVVAGTSNGDWNQGHEGGNCNFSHNNERENHDAFVVVLEKQGDTFECKALATHDYNNEDVFSSLVSDGDQVFVAGEFKRPDDPNGDPHKVLIRNYTIAQDGTISQDWESFFKAPEGRPGLPGLELDLDLGEVVVAGSFGGAFGFGDLAPQFPSSLGKKDLFVARLDVSSGDLVVPMERFGGVDDDLVGAQGDGTVEVDGNSNYPSRKGYVSNAVMVVPATGVTVVGGHFKSEMISVIEDHFNQGDNDIFTLSLTP